MLLTITQVENILAFWFPNDNYNSFWFDKSVDLKIYNDYYLLLDETFYKILKSSTSELELLEYNELLALIIMFDQFSRNISRILQISVSPMTEEAKKLAMICINKKYYLNKGMNHICFILMPLRHLNKINDYYIIVKILNELEDKKNNEIFIKFRNQTIKKLNLLKD